MSEETSPKRSKGKLNYTLLNLGLAMAAVAGLANSWRSNADNKQLREQIDAYQSGLVDRANYGANQTVINVKDSVIKEGLKFDTVEIYDDHTVVRDSANGDQQIINYEKDPNGYQVEINPGAGGKPANIINYSQNGVELMNFNSKGGSKLTNKGGDVSYRSYSFGGPPIQFREVDFSKENEAIETAAKSFLKTFIKEVSLNTSDDKAFTINHINKYAEITTSYGLSDLSVAGHNRQNFESATITTSDGITTAPIRVMDKKGVSLQSKFESKVKELLENKAELENLADEVYEEVNAKHKVNPPVIRNRQIPLTSHRADPDGRIQPIDPAQLVQTIKATDILDTLVSSLNSTAEDPSAAVENAQKIISASALMKDLQELSVPVKPHWHESIRTAANAIESEETNSLDDELQKQVKEAIALVEDIAAPNANPTHNIADMEIKPSQSHSQEATIS